MKRICALILLALLLALPAAAQIQDRRYCGPPARDADGVILRSRKVLREFQLLYPCPSTGLSYGACPDWFKDHTLPLVCGGCDSIENLGWLPGPIKTCAGKVCKDRWERRVYCRAPPVPPPEPEPVAPDPPPDPDPALSPPTTTTEPRTEP